LWWRGTTRTGEAQMRDNPGGSELDPVGSEVVEDPIQEEVK